MYFYSIVPIFILHIDTAPGYRLAVQSFLIVFLYYTKVYKMYRLITSTIEFNNNVLFRNKKNNIMIPKKL